MICLDCDLTTVFQSQFTVFFRKVQNTKTESVSLDLVFTAFQKGLNDFYRIRSNRHCLFDKVRRIPLGHLFIRIRKMVWICQQFSTVGSSSPADNQLSL